MAQNPNIKAKSDLLSSSTRMKASLRILKEINSKANLIAFNAAIEGARTRGRLDSFSIVAEQILTQAFRQLELTEQLEKLVNKLHSVALSSTAARYYELAEDLIDMLDRNLFERNCDGQAWATFEENVKCLLEVAQIKEKRAMLESETEIQDEEALAQEICNNKFVQQSSALLEKIMGVYVVYTDIFCLDTDGLIVSAGKNRELIGKKSYKNQEWFKQAVSNKVHVTDMVWVDELESYSVFYSAPVHDENGIVIGVLSTRFNWYYAQEMIESGNYQSNVSSFVINKNGLVLASSNKVDIYKDMLHWLDAGKGSIQSHSGYTIETARNGAPIAVGYAKTKGYNAYKGKEWAAIITANLGNIDYQHLNHRVGENKVNEEEGDEDRIRIESEICNLDLIKCMNDINELVELINKTNNETDMLAINAAIQAGIAGTEGESFAVIAGEIGSLAEKSVEFVDEVNKTTKDLQDAVSETAAARISDAARDAIEKVDRNLFERNCDVQAWATFALLKSVAQQGDKDGFASDLLAKIHKIYEVYHDIILLNHEGKIVAAGIRRELVGQNQNNRKWFQEAIQGKVSVTDVYFSNTVNALSMTFSAPVMGDDGTVIGVLSTRFNWKFIYDIIDAVIVDSSSEVNLVNSEGIVIGSSDREVVLKKSYKHYKAFKEASKGKSGHLVESDTDEGKDYAIGYCRTRGYNNYEGKGWCVLIRRSNEEEEKYKNKKAA